MFGKRFHFRGCCTSCIPDLQSLPSGVHRPQNPSLPAAFLPPKMRHFRLLKKTCKSSNFLLTMSRRGVYSAVAWEIVGETGFDKNSNSPAHLPVMPSEVLSWLQPHSGGIYVDCTVGYCGHAKEILRVSQPHGTVLGIDRDVQAINAARQELQSFGDRAILVKAHFMELKQILVERGIPRVHGVLFDLGVSSPQFDEPSRGFSFRSKGRSTCEWTKAEVGRRLIS